MWDERTFCNQDLAESRKSDSARPYHKHFRCVIHYGLPCGRSQTSGDCSHLNTHLGRASKKAPSQGTLMPAVSWKLSWDAYAWPLYVTFHSMTAGF